jgi:hypothetical protein
MSDAPYLGIVAYTFPDYFALVGRQVAARIRWPLGLHFYRGEFRVHQKACIFEFLEIKINDKIMLIILYEADGRMFDLCRLNSFEYVVLIMYVITFLLLW